MRVLDIYENFCWSFECENAVALRQLRVAAALTDPAVRDAELNSITASQAYRLVGDAVTFELADDFFDEISVEYPPTILKRLVLTQKVKRWLNADGNLCIPEIESEAPARAFQESYIPLRGPVLARAS